MDQFDFSTSMILLKFAKSIFQAHAYAWQKLKKIWLLLALKPQTSLYFP